MRWVGVNCSLFVVPRLLFVVCRWLVVVCSYLFVAGVRVGCWLLVVVVGWCLCVVSCVLVVSCCVLFVVV